jgi:1-deoxy-D-xylulose-5-phosphate synthase
MDRVPVQIPIGKWEVIREGADAVILSFGPMLRVAAEAAKALNTEGVHVGIVNARFLKPLDGELLNTLAKAGKPVLTLEEGVLSGGFGSSVLEYFAEHGVQDLAVDIMGIPDQFVEHGSVRELWKELGLTADGVCARIRKLIKKPVSDQKHVKRRITLP